MTKNSIDFQPLAQENQDAVPVRHSFRVPVSNKDNILAVLDGQSYAVANVSVSGVAIYSESCLEFEAGQILEDAELLIGAQRFTGLTGKVMHCSVHASGSLQFGINWLDMAEQVKLAIESRLAEIKDLALEKNQISQE